MPQSKLKTKSISVPRDELQKVADSIEGIVVRLPLEFKTDLGKEHCTCNQFVDNAWCRHLNLLEAHRYCQVKLHL
jgi:hypothetical protein